MDALIKQVFEVHGLDLFSFDATFLHKILVKRADALAETASAYGLRLVRDFAEAQTFLQMLRVGYSEFFRNTLAFAMLERSILPGLIEDKEKAGQHAIRIWSAGCATGQEAWSLAILLDDLIRLQGSSIAYRIIATDRYEPDLIVARAGLYSEDEVGNVRMSHLRSYFSTKNASFQVSSELKDRVTFSVYDLLDEQTSCPPESIFGNFDLVFCSNVLLYYRPEKQMFILNKLRFCLASGGYLVTDETEGRIVEGVGGFQQATSPVAIFVKDWKNMAR